MPEAPADRDRHLDLLVLGSGVAGLSAAVNASTLGLRVGVLTKGELSQSATRWAQGGVAAVLGGDPDSTDLHLADTLAAGMGLCDLDAVRVMVDEGPGRVNELIALGAEFDLDASGRLDLAREGGHSVARVVHAGGAATGAEIERALVDAARATAATVLEGWFAADLWVDAGECGGVVAYDPAGQAHVVRARHTLLATGGAGQLYSVTTNPREATGDGLAMALRAEVAAADLEFVQFHPTALHHPRMPRPLLSEALRGHGALLRDAEGERFVDELLPRDVVSRAMAERMAEQGVEHLWLDATHLERFAERFPTISSAVRACGLDPSAEWLPIAPAAHYTIGGVITDLDGASSMPGLWAAGEAACAGVHGANRLASNSLLEGMVFAARVIEAIAGGRRGPEATGAMRTVMGEGGERVGLPPRADVDSHGDRLGREPASTSSSPMRSTPPTSTRSMREELQRAMTRGAGVSRTAASLQEARRAVARIAADGPFPADRAGRELANLADVAAAVVHAAASREESRGTHNRADFPKTVPAFEVRLIVGPRP